MKKINSLVVITLLVLFAGIAYGQGMRAHMDRMQQADPEQYRQHMMPMRGGVGMMHGGTMGGQMMGQMTPSVYSVLRQADRLDLSTEQLTQLQKQTLTLRKDLIQLRSSVQTRNIELQEYLLADDINQKKLLQLLDQRTEAYAAVQRRMAESFFTARKVLTDTQRTDLLPMSSGRMMGQGMVGPGPMHQPMRMNQSR
ncbi:MAG TPA: hypothetical protein VKA68_16435 [bacterium]|nr:hypothetical protein [bacterium]